MARVAPVVGGRFFRDGVVVDRSGRGRVGFRDLDGGDLDSRRVGRGRGLRIVIIFFV